MTYQLDSAHSELGFSVRHMGLANVSGRFDEFDIDASFDEKGNAQSVIVTIQTASIQTNNNDRDTHLRSADFFEVENYPVMRFELVSIKGSRDNAVVEGNLTIKDTTHPVQFKAELSEFITDPWGKQRIAVEGSGKLNRNDWGLTWSQLLETGSLLVGRDVKFNFSVQFVKQ